MDKNAPKSLWFESMDSITDFQRHDTVEYVLKADADKDYRTLYDRIKELEKETDNRHSDIRNIYRKVKLAKDALEII